MAHVISRFPVQQDLKTPLYHQIYMILHEKIQHGEYTDSKLLPSEFEIAREYGVSRITANSTQLTLITSSPHGHNF